MKRHHPGLAEFLNPPAENSDQLPLPGSCSYDGIVNRPVFYQDAVQREKAIAEEIENENRRQDALVRRGKLFTLEQVQERDDKWNRAASEEAEKVNRLLDGIESINPEQRKLFLEHSREWRKRMSDALAMVHK